MDINLKKVFKYLFFVKIKVNLKKTDFFKLKVNC